MAIKLAVSGAHSTGKSTFLGKVKRILVGQGIEVAGVSNLAVECPLPILRDHTPESTLWIVASGIAQEIAASKDAEVVLVDRPVLDAWAYLKTATRWSQFDLRSPQIRTLKGAIAPWLEQYDYWYQTQLEESAPIGTGKDRDVDPEYRRHVAAQMIEAVHEFGCDPRELTFATLDEEAARIADEIVAKLRR